MKKSEQTEAEYEKEQKEKAVIRSQTRTMGFINAAYTIDSLYDDRLDVITVSKELRESVERLKDGNMREIEMMLMSQAKTLEAFFHRTLSQVPGQMFHDVHILSDVALRAQNQCRKTLLALAEVKNPRRTTFVKQQNNGINQQVNNNSSQSKKLTTPKKFSNELLEVKDGQRLDSGTTITPSEANTAMATVEVSGRQNSRRKKN